MIEVLKIMIIGIIEGITEWLPISSTGHMILADEWINMNMSPSFRELFLVVIQLGAISAVGVLFFKKLNPFIKDKKERMNVIMTWLKIAFASLPVAVLGLLLDDWLTAKLYNYITVALMLIVYGVVFIVVENHMSDKKANITSIETLPFKTAFLIGLFQVLALIPGTSRSGATIIGGLIVGASRFVAAEFSFFLSIPAMVGASLLKLYKYGFDFTSDQIIALVVGMLVSFLMSIVAIRFLIGYVKKHDFKVFGYYRIALGIVVVVYFIVTNIPN
ncbi:MAG: undecaprenyl-diphosphate phosphatase [Candidatus Izemoplasma sp.]|nr:undecaprenyl-diphosphate phosphatase [Candidatus Izemoplasma sp.]